MNRDSVMINRNDFEKLVERRIDFITTDAIFRAWSNEEIYKKCTGFPDLATEKSAFVDFKYYASHVDIDRVKQLALKTGAANFANSFCKQGEEYGEDALAYSEWIRKSNWSEKTLGELLHILKKFDEKALKIIAFTWPTHPIALAVEGELRRIVENKIINKTQVDHVIAVLSFPTRENSPVVENRKLMKIALELQRGEKRPSGFNDLSVALQEKLRRHVEKFGFLGARGAGLKQWSVEDVFKRADEMAKDVKLKEKFGKSKLETRENRKEIEKIESQLNFTKEERKLVEAAKELVYFRTYRTEAMYHVYSDVEPLLAEIGKRCGYTLEEMQCLSTEEILNIEQTKPNQSLITERQKGFVVVLENGKIIEFTGEKRKEIEKLFEEKTLETELRGTIACKGKVTGSAKVVLTSVELDKVKRGDILITSMTTPDMIVAMQRAAAFVTNEGGMTCHAAIVARELNKPCIIGTKVATSVFKDSDLVEVDAMRGIVKKLVK